jgi:signal transduction histidine kinase
MDISEAESGAMHLRRETLALGDVVGRAVDLYRDVAEAKGVAIEVLAPFEVTVSADRTRLGQVLANLIDNAVKYAAAGGQVTITVGRDQRGAIVQVRDTGVGIPADELPRIWDRLFRGDASRTERGLGLGLSLVRAVVQAHGGSVDVVSETGQGSTFTIALPA